MMPGMDGEKTFDALQKIIRRKGKSVPVVMLSAGAQDEQQYFMRRGFSGYLQKPLNQEQLLELLFKLLPSEKVKVKA